MMGRRERGQGQFFYEFHLDDVVPPDHLVRKIEADLDLGWVHKELAPYYSYTGRPSIDPELMIRMLIVGYAGRHPLGARDLRAGAGQLGLQVVLWLEHRRTDHEPLLLLARPARALPCK